MTTYYRGDDQQTGGRWYARSREYAAFFGGQIAEIEVAAADILDLRRYGVGDEETVIDIAGMPEYRQYEVYQYVERADVQAAARSLGYRAIRCRQWHADYDGDERGEDALYLLA